MSIWLRIGGYPATEIGAHSPVTWETTADGGSFKASWSFSLSVRSQHQGLRVDSPVDVMCGGLPVWSGSLSYPDRTSGEYTAYGWSAMARKMLALDGGGNATRDVSAAITRAQAVWPVTNPTGVAGTASGDVGAPITLGQLLDDFAAQLGMRWGVDGRRRLYCRPDPTSPSWLASPGASAFGATNEDRAKTLAGRYLDSVTSLNETVIVGTGQPEEAVDLTDRGAMGVMEASAILGGMLALGKGGSAWTNGVDLTRDQLTTMGGSRAALAAVRGQQLMRSFGFAYEGRPFALDTVIGTTRYTQGSDVIYVEPVNTTPSTFVGVVAA